MRIDAENRVRWVCKEQLLLLLLLLSLYGVVGKGHKVHLHCSCVPPHRLFVRTHNVYKKRACVLVLSPVAYECKMFIYAFVIIIFNAIYFIKLCLAVTK